jgi:uncharacterized oligopeptide transporter (OPT) family protein
MVKESSFGLTKAHIMETFSRTTFTDKVSIVGLTAVSTMVNGSTTRWRVKAPSLGVMEEDMKETTRMIRSTAMVHSSGQMVESTSVTGAKVSNTAKVSTSKRARRDKVSGRWARELNGSRMPAALQINDHFEFL